MRDGEGVGAAPKPALLPALPPNPPRSAAPAKLREDEPTPEGIADDGAAARAATGGWESGEDESRPLAARGAARVGTPSP